MFLYIFTYQNYAKITDMSSMSISKQVKNIIEKIKPDSIFGLKDFEEIKNPQAVVLELSRLYKKGAIKKLAKGKFFVPRKTRFGDTGPSEWQVLNNIIQESGGYFSDTIALNRLGATTQVPNEVIIRGARSTRKTEVGNLTIQFFKQGNPDANHLDANLTDILEGIRLIKKTPDGNLKLSLERISLSFKNLRTSDKERLIALSLKERPYVRALLGAIIELGQMGETLILKKSLNSITKYNLGIPKKLLPNKDNWRIN